MEKGGKHKVAETNTYKPALSLCKMSPDTEIVQKKERVKAFLSNKYLMLLIIILVFSFIIRIYYFSQTTQQAVWWDEAEYLATAKHWTAGVPYEINPQRPPLYQFLVAVLFWLGLGELSVKFLLTLVPAIILVFAIYLLGKEMFDKRIAIISAFLAAVSWTFIFWSIRAQPDFLSLTFQILSISYMWKYWKNNSLKLIILSGIFSALGFFFKVSGLLVPLAFMLFIFFKDRLTAFKKKHYYYYASSFIITLVPYFIWSYLNFGTPFAFKHGYSNLALASTAAAPFGWYNLKFFYTLTENALFILFILGFVLCLQFLFYLDMLIRDKKRFFDPTIFSILVIIIVSAFYIFYIRGTEDRWVYLWLPFIFFLSSKAVVYIYEKIKVYKKSLAIFIVVILLMFVAFRQIQHANLIIKEKKDSYIQVKQAGLWLKENANKRDSVLSASYTQTVYYSEINVTHITNDALNDPQFQSIAAFDSYINNTKPRYLMLSAFEYHPPAVYEWPQHNLYRLKTARAAFADSQRQQPILILYEIIY